MMSVIADYDYALSFVAPLLLIVLILYCICVLVLGCMHLLVSIFLWTFVTNNNNNKVNNGEKTSAVVVVDKEAGSNSSTINSNNPLGGYLSGFLVLLLSIIASDHNPTTPTTVMNFNNNMTQSSGLFDLITGTNPKLQTLLEKVPSLTVGPKAPLFFKNRHVQFLPWMIQNEIHRRKAIPYQRIDIQVTGCYNKSSSTTATMKPEKDGNKTFAPPPHYGYDSLCEPSAKMNDTISIDIFPPLQNVDSKYNENFNWTSPIIMFAPGLRCDSQDMPGNSMVRRAYSEGFRSIVVNRRGHVADIQAPRWNLFGDVDDMEQVYWYIKHQISGPNTPIFLHGFSSGTAVVVSGLAKWDKRLSAAKNSARPTPTFVASTSITPGYDTSTVLSPHKFKFPYNQVLTPLVKDHFIQKNEKVLRQFNSTAVDIALNNATSLQEVLDASVPFAGYQTPLEYYQHENPVNGIHYITTPKLVLNSIDDPCCDIHNLYETSTIAEHDEKTYAQLVSESLNGIVAVSRTGSHCTFIDSSNSLLPSMMKDPLDDDGSWMLDIWSDRVSIEFYKAALEVYGDRRFL